MLKKFGPVDVLVNGAGINSPTPFFDIPEDEFDRILTVNLKGLMLACQIFGRHMVERGSGSIINLGSASRADAVVTRVHLLGVEGSGS